MINKAVLNILIIEDNEGDLELVKEYLSEYCIPEVVHAKSSSSAVRILASAGQFDAILLDLTLPDKQGNELIDEILAAAGDCPVIILTGYSNIDFSIQSISRGISDYLLKDDLNAIMLYKSLTYCVQRRKKMREVAESEKRYSDLFHNSPQPMWLINAETLRFVLVNNAALQLYGYTEEEFLALKGLDLYAEINEERYIEVLRRDMEVSYKGRFRQLTKSGKILEVDVYSNPLMIEDKLHKTVIAVDVTEKLSLEREVQEQKLLEHLRLMKAVTDAQEKERAEIGAELHDNVNQLLAASKLYLRHALSQEDGKPFILATEEYISNAIEEIRKLSHALVGPTRNNEIGLCESIEQLISSITAVKDIRINFCKALPSEKDMDPGLKLVIYRIIQEQLTNILKYAQATEAEIAISAHPDRLVVNINDNGKGFDTSAKRSGIGLRNINHRAGLYRGVVEIKSSKGKGCKMKITFNTVDHAA